MNVFWFRRDLRTQDNSALAAALKSEVPVLPLFIFDTHITNELPKDDSRISFIYKELEKINKDLNKQGTGLWVFKGDPLDVFKSLVSQKKIQSVFVNRDYEPYARERDAKIKLFLQENGVGWNDYKDHVLFEPGEVTKPDGSPYTVFTPYKNACLRKLDTINVDSIKSNSSANYAQHKESFPSLEELGFVRSKTRVLPYNLSVVDDYHERRDFPAMDATSKLGPHLRFGTIGIRSLLDSLDSQSPGYSTFFSELMWREFFIQILWHFPHVVHQNFRKKYDGIQWRNNEAEFEKWCKGETGYPMVDAGMRELNTTGYMHNRVRMVTASFLCKHLLIDWRWGEAYFAKNLLDYELSSNNGNWQWAAGTGCDAAPYFRVFNPSEQLKKFDKHQEYILKWVPEFNTFQYGQPMVDHKIARERALQVYKEGIQN